VPSRAALLDALTATGPAAVASLLRLTVESEHDRAATHEILVRLALVDGAGPELAVALERERVPLELACRALAIVRHPSGVAWLEERCASSRERPHALAALAEIEGPAPLASLVRLARAGRVPREDALGLLASLLERDAARAVEFTLDLRASNAADAAREWLALLIESGHPGGARALVHLTADATLPDDDRQWAALAVGELGDRMDGELLLAELERARGAEPERRGFAAGLLSVHALLGAEGVERLLAPCSPSSRARVLSALGSAAASASEASRAAVNVHRVARALEGALAELAAPGSVEIL
jgi:hypothetical protein